MGLRRVIGVMDTKHNSIPDPEREHNFRWHASLSAVPYACLATGKGLSWKSKRIKQGRKAYSRG
jgi:hypothetical protein